MSNSSPMKRMWINQPSTLQSLHDLHGTNVLACTEDYTERTVIIYYLSGDVISSVVPKLCLSNGWIRKNDVQL